jgi:hypothetical protein
MQDFRTHDLPTIAVLLHKQCKLRTLDRSDPSGKVIFVFEDSDDLQKILRAYWTDSLLCPAQSLLTSLKRAKHILYDFHS